MFFGKDNSNDLLTKTSALEVSGGAIGTGGTMRRLAQNSNSCPPDRYPAPCCPDPTVVSENRTCAAKPGIRSTVVTDFCVEKCNSSNDPMFDMRCDVRVVKEQLVSFCGAKPDSQGSIDLVVEQQCNSYCDLSACSEDFVCTWKNESPGLKVN